MHIDSDLLDDSHAFHGNDNSDLRHARTEISGPKSDAVCALVERCKCESFIKIYCVLRSAEIISGVIKYLVFKGLPRKEVILLILYLSFWLSKGSSYLLGQG